MKALALVLLAFHLVSSTRAETVKITDSAFAKTVVEVSDSSLAQHQVYFTKTAIGADCGLYITNSSFADSTVKIVKNSLFATKVREVNSRWKANAVVYVAKSAFEAFGHCDFAAALIKR